MTIQAAPIQKTNSPASDSVLAGDLESAFGPGCDAWIVSSLDNSNWARKLDWYLNFQIMKATEHRSRTLSTVLIKIVEEAEFELPPIAHQVENPPLMIASSHLLPAAKTIVVPSRSDLAAWTKSCAAICRNLFSAAEPGHLRVRIFLPDLVTSKEFQKLWPADDASLPRIDIVPWRA